MKGILRKVDDHLEYWLVMIFYSLVVITIAVEVIRRFALSYSSVWGEEVARYAFIYLVWMGAAMGVKQRLHIRIDILSQFMPPRGKAVVFLLGDLCTMLLAGFCFYISIAPVQLSVEYGSVTDGLRISKSWFMLAVPFGFSLVLYRVLRLIREDIHHLIAGTEIPVAKSIIDE